MKNLILITVWLSLMFMFSCNQENKEFSNSFTVDVSNSTALSRTNVMVRLSIEDLNAKHSDFNPDAFIVLDGEAELSSQVFNSNNAKTEILFILPSVGANENKELTIRYNPEGAIERNYPKLTQAELSHKVGGEWKEREYIGGEFKNVNFLRVPDEHKDHSWYLRYEGPGWESDKVGYRFYLDQRNATDVFGKKVTEPVLQNVGLDGFDSYHELEDWGMDVMKVGGSLGVGSIGMFVDSVAHRVEFTDSVTALIESNGAIFSSIVTNYYGWKTPVDSVDLESQISIHAGSRITHQVLNLTHDTEFICTGVAKDKNGELLIKAPTDNNFGYIASFGQYSLNNDNLGVAVLFDKNSFIEFTEDQYSHIVRLNSDSGVVEYDFLATWEGEPGGIKTKTEFIDYLEATAVELANPVITNIN